MAFVGISNNLIDDVSAKTYQMRDAEVNSLGQPSTHIASLQGSESWLQEAIWGEHIALRDAIPGHWCGAATEIAASIAVGAPPESEVHNMYFRFPSDVRFQPRFNPRTTAMKMRVNSISEAPIELQPYLTWCVQRSEITQRWNKVRLQVLEFLQTCKSLNEALKLWPDLRVYVPKEYLERVERKVERQKAESKAAEALAKLNTDELMAAAVTARLASAGV